MATTTIRVNQRFNDLVKALTDRDPGEAIPTTQQSHRHDGGAAADTFGVTHNAAAATLNPMYACARLPSSSEAFIAVDIPSRYGDNVPWNSVGGVSIMAISLPIAARTLTMKHSADPGTPGVLVYVVPTGPAKHLAGNTGYCPAILVCANAGGVDANCEFTDDANNEGVKVHYHATPTALFGAKEVHIDEAGAINSAGDMIAYGSEYEAYVVQSTKGRPIVIYSTGSDPNQNLYFDDDAAAADERFLFTSAGGPPADIVSNCCDNAIYALVNELDVLALRFRDDEATAEDRMGCGWTDATNHYVRIADNTLLQVVYDSGAPGDPVYSDDVSPLVAQGNLTGTTSSTAAVMADQRYWGIMESAPVVAPPA